MNLIPHGTAMVGRLVDVRQSVHLKLELPQGEKRNVTVFAVVDSVGPDVKRAKPGDFIIFHRCNHVILRNGMHAVIVHDEDIWTTVEIPAAELGMLSIEKPSFGVKLALERIEPASELPQ